MKHQPGLFFCKMKLILKETLKTFSKLLKQRKRSNINTLSKKLHSKTTTSKTKRYRYRHLNKLSKPVVKTLEIKNLTWTRSKRRTMNSQSLAWILVDKHTSRTKVLVEVWELMILHWTSISLSILLKRQIMARLNQIPSKAKDRNSPNKGWSRRNKMNTMEMEAEISEVNKFKLKSYSVITERALKW